MSAYFKKVVAAVQAAIPEDVQNRTEFLKDVDDAITACLYAIHTNRGGLTESTSDIDERNVIPLIERLDESVSYGCWIETVHDAIADANLSFDDEPEMLREQLTVGLSMASAWLLYIWRCKPEEEKRKPG